MSKKQKNIFITLGVVVLLVLVTSPKLKLFNTEAGSPPPGSMARAGLPVSVYVVKPDKISNRIMATGTVLANEEVELRSEITGKVEQILFREGSWAKKGDLLVKINDSELQAQLMKLQSQEGLAAEKERRRKLLYDKQNISPEDYEVALNELNSIRAETQLVKAKIEKTEIRAPFDGVIGLRFVSAGSYLSPERPIASLQSVNPVKIDFSIPEKYVHAVARNQTIHFAVAGSKEKFAGKIYAIEPKIDPVTRTVQIRAMCPNKDGRVIPGAFAEVELVLQQLDDALMVPTEAIVPEAQGQKVFLYRNGTAQPQKVETGMRTETKIQITSGLQANDTLITSGILQLVAGMPVSISSAN